jgi:hypothetical protein
MEWLLVLVVVAGVAGWLVVRRRAPGTPVGPVDAPPGTPAGASAASSLSSPLSSSVPLPASGRPVRLSSFGRVPVQGTNEHQEQLTAVLRALPPPAAGSRAVPVVATLVPEAPDVAVEVDGHRVGRLPRGSGHLSAVSYLAERGERGWVPARVTRTAHGSLGAYLEAGDADVLLPRNQPDDLDLLEAHAPVPLTGTQDAQVELDRVLGPSVRASCFVGLEVGRLVGGRFDGEPCLQASYGEVLVGRLTATTTRDYLPFVEPVRAHGGRPGAEAVLSRGGRGIEVTLHLPPVAD